MFNLFLTVPKFHNGYKGCRNFHNKRLFEAESSVIARKRRDRLRWNELVHSQNRCKDKFFRYLR